MTDQRSLTVLIPGVPVPQGRGRIVWPFAKGGGRKIRPRIMDPQRARDWKEEAAKAYRMAMLAAGYRPPLYAAHVPVNAHVYAVFARPQSDGPGPSYPHTKARGDADNVLKAVQDAGNGLLWVDDAQVTTVLVGKWVAAYGCQPYVQVVVWPQSVDVERPPDWPVGGRMPSNS